MGCEVKEAVRRCRGPGLDQINSRGEVEVCV